MDLADSDDLTVLRNCQPRHVMTRISSRAGWRAFALDYTGVSGRNPA